MSNSITPVQNTNAIRIVDFVKINIGGQDYCFCTYPKAIWNGAVSSSQITGVGQLVKIGDATRDIKSTANETSITLVGIEPTMLATVLNSKIKGSPIQFWHGFYDANNNIISNLLIYSNDLTKTANWFLNGGTVAVTQQTTNPLNASDKVYKFTYSGSDPYIGQTIETNAPIGGRTFTLSVYARTTSTFPVAAQLFLYNATVTNVGSTDITLINYDWKRYSFTFTFDSSNTGTSFNARFDAATNAAANSEVHLCNFQVTEGGAAQTYLPTTTANNFGVYQFFNGVCNTFSISEQWIEELRQYIGSISVSASSIQLILQNKIVGRYTNAASWKLYNPADNSMDRVAYISTITPAFGKDADPNS